LLGFALVSCFKLLKISASVRRIVARVDILCQHIFNYDKFDLDSFSLSTFDFIAKCLQIKRLSINLGNGREDAPSKKLIFWWAFSF